MDCCSGGGGMWFDAVFCGSCLYYQMLEELDGASEVSSFCCMLRSPCTWLNPFWMCGGHAELRWRIAQRHHIPVSLLRRAVAVAAAGFAIRLVARV